MQSLIEFFGGPALTAAVCLGAIVAAILAAIGASEAKKFDRILFVLLILSVYFLLILGVRGIVLFYSS